MKKTTRKVLSIVSIILAVATISLILVNMFIDNSKILIVALTCSAVAQFTLQMVMRHTKAIEEN